MCYNILLFARLYAEQSEQNLSCKSPNSTRQGSRELNLRDENTKAPRAACPRPAGTAGWQPGPGCRLCSHVPHMRPGLPQCPYHRTTWTQGHLKETACQYKYKYLAFYWFQKLHWNPLPDPQNNPLRWAGQRMFRLSVLEVSKEAEKLRGQTKIGISQLWIHK